MDGKIGLEEHFAIPETLDDSKGFLGDAVWPELQSRLLDIQEKRLRLMDAHGMELMLLSLNAPAVQGIPDPKRAIGIARRANDFLAGEVAKRPQRFQGLAALAMQDPDEATRELRRCVEELGFRGALVNGFSQVRDPGSMVYLDDARYRGFWAELEKLDVPFYPQVHALRLMACGVFDAHPRIQIVLGHMGEGLPYSIWRVDNRNAWTKQPPRYPAKRKLGEYFRENFHITTSGNFRTQTLIDAILELGADRIMFSTDWPFENIDHAADWFDAAAIAEADRVKIGRSNALRLFKLSAAA